MTIRAILHFPDPRLRTLCKPVDTVDSDIRTLIDDMLETMYDAPGIGLAAPQVGDFRRIIVVDVSEEGNAPLALINPEIIETEGKEVSEEGCLSVPGAYEKVERADQIRVKALDKHGEPVELEVHGLEAVCIQHEIDHLNGKLFVDYLSNLKRERIRKKIEKQRRQNM